MMAGWGRSGRIIIEFDPPKNCFIFRSYLKKIPKEYGMLHIVFQCFIFLVFFFLLKVISGLQTALRTGLD